MCDSSLTHGLQPMDWLDSQGHKKSMFGKWVRRHLGKYVDGSVQMEEGYEDTCVPTKGDFN